MSKYFLRYQHGLWTVCQDTGTSTPLMLYGASSFEDAIAFLAQYTYKPVVVMVGAET